MYRYSFPDDPYYTDGPAGFIRDAVSELLDYEVVAVSSVARRLLEIDRRHQEILVRAGLPIAHFHKLIGSAALFIAGGPSWAPEMLTRPRLSLVPDEREA